VTVEKKSENIGKKTNQYRIAQEFFVHTDWDRSSS